MELAVALLVLTELLALAEPVLPASPSMPPGGGPGGGPPMPLTELVVPELLAELPDIMASRSCMKLDIMSLLVEVLLVEVLLVEDTVLLASLLPDGGGGGGGCIEETLLVVLLESVLLASVVSVVPSVLLAPLCICTSMA